MKDAVFIFSYATLYSLLEIELEAKEGWCKNLPTPVVLGNFTLYHILMNIIVILTISKVYIKDITSIEDISLATFYIAAWFLIEDFMWFILNPYYTIDKYKKEEIWWHARRPWYFGIPEHNLVGLGVMFICYSFSNKKSEMYVNIIYILIFSLLTIMLADNYHEYYKSIH
jgi:hypothetical protein